MTKTPTARPARPPPRPSWAKHLRRPRRGGPRRRGNKATPPSTRRSPRPPGSETAGSCPRPWAACGPGGRGPPGSWAARAAPRPPPCAPGPARMTTWPWLNRPPRSRGWSTTTTTSPTCSGISGSPAGRPSPASAGDDDAGRPPIKCDRCHQPFRPAKPLGRMPKYCGQSCRQRAFEARKEEDILRNSPFHGIVTDPDKLVPTTAPRRVRRSVSPRDGSR